MFLKTKFSWNCFLAYPCNVYQNRLTAEVVNRALRLLCSGSFYCPAMDFKKFYMNLPCLQAPICSLNFAMLQNNANNIYWLFSILAKEQFIVFK